MKNGGKNKSVAFIILFSVLIFFFFRFEKVRGIIIILTNIMINSLKWEVALHDIFYTLSV